MVTATWSGYQPYPPFGDCELVLWDVDSGAQILTLPDAEDQYLVTFSATGRYLLTGGRTRAILRNAKTGKPIRTFTDKEAFAALSVAMSPDGK